MVPAEPPSPPRYTRKPAASDTPSRTREPVSAARFVSEFRPRVPPGGVAGEEGGEIMAMSAPLAP